MAIGRMTLAAAGFAMLALGLAGTVLPLLPATPFFLAAAWLFSRSSPRLERWLYRMPVFGNSVRLWRAHGCIGRRAKCVAVASIAVGALLVVQSPAISSVVTAVLVAIMLGVVGFILSRPSAPAGVR